MLTQSEREWLAWKYRIRRDKDLAGAWCQNCPHLGRNAAGCYGDPYCPLFPDMQDALEFEGRVAEKLAINDTSYLPCHQKGHENQCPYDNYCPTDKKKTAWCKMKHARLQVEEEMDGQDDA